MPYILCILERFEFEYEYLIISEKMREKPTFFFLDANNPY